jgi:hypothetical protein
MHGIVRSGLRLAGILIAFVGLGVGRADAAQAVAFVHGTGSQTNATGDYWTWGNIDSIRRGLANIESYRVANCDLNQYAWHANAAGCVAGVLSGISAANGTLVVNTHSQGGNVLRWILSNPTWDSRYPAIINKIQWVNAMAPSSLGTPLANAVINGNVFEQALGWIVGYATDAVRMQQTSWMPYYNAEWLYGTAGRPALPKGFWTVIGTDVESNPFDGDSWCGDGGFIVDGYAQQVALDNIQNVYLNACSDGFINCSSQEGAGTVWFRDKTRTADNETLSHNQSRRKCFNLDVILRDDLR